MPKRKRNTESCRPNKKQNTSSLELDAHTRTDPFTLLPWDCASIVLQYLDIRDLACCEQVSEGWRRFVQHWMVVSGHQYCLPDGWRPDISNTITYEDTLAAVKKSVVEYAAFRKLASGNASCGRRYQTSDTGVFDTSGNFTVWHTGDTIFYQKLGFQQDGSLYAVQRLPFRVTGDNLRYLAVNQDGYLYLQICRPNNHPVRPEEFRGYAFSLETGQRLWKRRASPNTSLFALGRKRVYFVGTGPQNRHLTAHDIKSGRLLYEVPFPHPIRRSKPPMPVQQLGGDEVIIHTDAVSSERSVSAIDYIHVINGMDGQVVQTIPTRIWCHGSQVIPQTDEQGGFAILSHHRTSHWYVKIQKFSQDAETRAFRSNSTEILDLGKYPDQIRQIGIEPYRHLAVSLEGRRVLPQIRTIQETQSLSMDVRSLSADAASKVDKWLCLGPGQEVTLPQKYKHHRARRLFIPGPLDYDPDSCRLNFAGWGRFVLFTEPRQFYCLFDFRFRVPNNMPSKVTPDPMTLELR